MDYLSFIKKRIEGTEKKVPKQIEDKVYIRQFAGCIGINTPHLLQVDTIENIVIDKLPNSFVLKPKFASTSIGVKLLEREGSLGFRDLISNELLTWKSIKEQCEIVSNRFFPDEPENAVYLVEELIFDQEGNTPPQDIRFYCFQGEVGLIVMEDHLNSSKAQAMYFDGDFLPFSDTNLRYGIANKANHLEEIVDAVPPENWQRLLNVAKRISISVPTPFARIDLYDTPKGVYLGEVTLTPGTFYYKNRKIMSNSENYRLGRMWLASEKRMSGIISF